MQAWELSGGVTGCWKCLCCCLCLTGRALLQTSTAPADPPVPRDRASRSGHDYHLLPSLVLFCCWWCLTLGWALLLLLLDERGAAHEPHPRAGEAVRLLPWDRALHEGARQVAAVSQAAELRPPCLLLGLRRRPARNSVAISDTGERNLSSRKSALTC